MGDWTGIPGIIQYRRTSPPDPQVFTGLELTEIDIGSDWGCKRGGEGGVGKCSHHRRSDDVYIALFAIFGCHLFTIRSMVSLQICPSEALVATRVPTGFGAFRC